MIALPFLALSAVLALAGALALWATGRASPQVLAHLAFVIGVLPLILAAMGYFVPVLTRSGSPPRGLLLSPLLALAGGLLLVLVLGGQAPRFLLHPAAASVLLGALGTGGWALRRVRGMIGKRHPGIDWYLAALLCLALAVALVPVFDALPADRALLRIAHLHANLLGFIGLTAIGTLQVLVPTCAGRPDPQAVHRLRAHRLPAFGGVLLIVLGSALSPALGAIGAALLAWTVLAMLGGFHRALGDAVWQRDAATASLFAATAGLLGLLVIGVAHAFGWVAGRALLAAFIVAFLLPLVTGAATHLLPLWRRPGRTTEWHLAWRRRLGWMSLPRAWMLVLGGWVLAWL